MQKQERLPQVEIKVTWRFVWSLSWRMWLLTMAFMVPLYLITFLFINVLFPTA